jgi:hypothetical protein
MLLTKPLTVQKKAPSTINVRAQRYGTRDS